MRRLARLRKRKRGGIKHIGTVSKREDLIGRPCDVYCNGWKPKNDNLLHEVLLTDVLLQYPNTPVVRGYDVDKKVRADAELTIDGHRFFVEFDTGTMGHSSLCYKWFKHYRNVTDFMLFITLGNDQRLNRVIDKAKQVNDIALFTTYAQVMKSPYEPIFIDRAGNTVALPYSQTTEESKHD